MVTNQADQLFPGAEDNKVKIKVYPNFRPIKKTLMCRLNGIIKRILNRN